MEYYIDSDLEFCGDDEDSFKYNGYCGNYETYYTFKSLLRVYLEGVTIYNYKGKYYTYDQLKNKYDIKSLEHSRFINDNLLEYHNDIDDAFKDLIDYHPDVIKVTCKCIDVKDPKEFLTDTLAKLKFIFKAKWIHGENKKITINPANTITMYLSDFL